MTTMLLFYAPSIAGQTIAFIVLGIAALIVVAIIVSRMQMSKNAESGELAEAYNSRPKKSPLDGRNKYPAVDVLRRSGTIFNIGMITSVLLTVLAFSWTNFADEIIIPADALEMEEDFEVEPPRTAEPPPPPPPPPPPVIEEVPEEEIEEEDEPVFIDQDIEEDEEVEIVEVEEEEIEEEPEVVEVEEEPEEETIFKVVEDMPRFPGCESKGISDKGELKKCAEEQMLKFIYGNIKYPAIARENSIEGKAILQFVVEKDGSVTGINVVREPGGGCGKEAERVVKMMPKWIPGRQRGNPVKVQYTLPVRFKLEN